MSIHKNNGFEGLKKSIKPFSVYLFFGGGGCGSGGGYICVECVGIYNFNAYLDARYPNVEFSKVSA